MSIIINLQSQNEQLLDDVLNFFDINYFCKVIRRKVFSFDGIQKFNESIENVIDAFYPDCKSKYVFTDSFQLANINITINEAQKSVFDAVELVLEILNKHKYTLQQRHAELQIQPVQISSENVSFHSAAGILINGQLSSYIETERLTRKKNIVQSNKETIQWCLDRSELYAPDNIKIENKDHRLQYLLSDHHLVHAWSAWAQCDFDDASILVIDGSGKNCLGQTDSIAIFHAKNNDIFKIKSYSIENSLGNRYGAYGQVCGLHDHSEGKFMGFAPYGNIQSIESFEKPEKPEKSTKYVLTDNIDGVCMNYGGTKEILDSILASFNISNPFEFGFDKADAARTMHQLFEDSVLKLCKWISENLPSRNLIITGGCALNCTTNGKVIRTKMFNIFIPTLCNDGGIALGELVIGSKIRIKKLLKYNKQTYEIPRFYNKVSQEVIVNKIRSGKVIAWFEGGSEYGPRALCHRSLLADPGNKRIAYRLNEIKSREYWRPLAPVVLDKVFFSVFEVNQIQQPHTCMLATEIIRENWRSKIPAVCAVDGTSRPQVLERDGSSDVLYDLMEKFDLPVLVNTSMNGRGEAICETPRQAEDFCKWHDDVVLCICNNGELYIHESY